MSHSNQCTLSLIPLADMIKCFCIFSKKYRSDSIFIFPIRPYPNDIFTSWSHRIETTTLISCVLSLSLHVSLHGLFGLASQDFCTDHKSRLSALEQHREVARAVTAAHATLQKAQTALTDALQVCVCEWVIERERL